MTVRWRAAHTPQRSGEELLPYCAVILAFVKRRPEIMPFEVRIDVAHNEAATEWPLHRGHPRHVLMRRKERRRCGKQAVEVPAIRIEVRLDIGDAAVASDHEIGDMTTRAFDALHQALTLLHLVRDFAAPRLEV